MNLLNWAVDVDFLNYDAAVQGILRSIWIVVEVEVTCATIGVYAMVTQYILVLYLWINSFNWCIKIAKSVLGLLVNISIFVILLSMQRH